MQKLAPIKKKENAKFLVDFTDALVLNIIFHRNFLQHYGSTVKPVADLSDHVYINLDISKNLPVPAKYEPKSMN